MKNAAAHAYDVAVIGAGPVGCVAAVAHARRGARVALLEANPNSANRLAGEWLHPTALSILASFGISRPASGEIYPNGRGFAVFPEDGSDAIILPYAEGATGLSIDHERLVTHLRTQAAALSLVTYLPCVRATAIDGHDIHILDDATGPEILRAERIVGADGRNSLVRAAAGLQAPTLAISRMAAVRLRDAELPMEGYGHVFLGGPGPLLVYRIDIDTVRMIMDLPHDLRGAGQRNAYLWEAFSPLLPASFRIAFAAALRTGEVTHGVNRLLPRQAYGGGHLYIVGDAVGYNHPLTAVGMTLGFQDAACLAGADSVAEYAKKRARDSRVPELLSEGLRDAFAGHTRDTVLVRSAIYALWRGSAHERARTMRFLACADTDLRRFAVPFAKTLGLALLALAREMPRASGRRQTLATGWRIARRAMLLVRDDLPGFIRSGQGHADPRPTFDPGLPPAPAGEALARASAVLVSAQKADGGWEGEMVWCPMITAQYTITWHMLGLELPQAHRPLILRQFQSTQLAGGLWGLHEHAEPSLFVTALIYVAARILGSNADDPMLAAALTFIRREGAVAIPTWGKVWLSMLGLYDWSGLAPMPPELWRLPPWLPTHPGKLYCHTRLIYLAMSIVYADRYVAPPTSLTPRLREELYAGAFAQTDWVVARDKLRRADLVQPPGRVLRAARWGLDLLERRHRPEARKSLLAELRERIRWELRTTDHTSISPVSGLLNIIALKTADGADVDATRAIEKFAGWIWRDDVAGLRVTGARSISWDTAFALQALAAAPSGTAVARAVNRGTAFLVSQQIRQSFGGFADNFRIDPSGGWCFAGSWHGWPVSDCTAEALSAFAATGTHGAYADVVIEGTRFLLRCQNPDGGFGSYEPRRTRIDLEIANPAEIFANSMTERSYVECTASCLCALSETLQLCPADLRAAAEHASERAVQRLLQAQRMDGSFEGAWGVYFVYGTLFGIRGLLAGGLPGSHPAVRKACRWLLARQRPDGGFGESHLAALSHSYVPAARGQIIQTAWALLALLQAGDPEWPAIEAAARFLIARQTSDGSWPREQMVGIFFHTALLHYDLYRCYFPLWALSLYETRRLARTELFGAPKMAAPEDLAQAH